MQKQKDSNELLIKDVNICNHVYLCTLECFILFNFYEKIADQDLHVGYLKGTFAALGFALMMEGFMSAAYHICPNEENFQYGIDFDIMIVSIKF